jgi:GxxExxY protein
MHQNEIASIVIEKSIRMHRLLGPGLLESVYETILVHELKKEGLLVHAQVPIPIVYDNIEMPLAFRLDIKVENSVILEIKSTEGLAPVHYKQLLTYLRLTNKKLGLLLNFNVALMKDGIHRVVNGL